MRDIKLWDKKQKKFLTKFYYFYKDGDFEFYNNDRDFKNGIMNTNIIVVESTGLKDKNGVDIYEGDIVNHNDFIGYVKYINKGNCNVLGYALVSLINNKIFYIFCDETDNYEVIGNIYKNPELL